MKFSAKYLILLVISFSLLGCGSSDDEAPAPTPDTTAPVITLTGPASVTLTVGDAYQEQGSSASDNIDGTVNVTVSGSVDTATVGSYVLTYTAADSAGNTSSVTRTIIVEAAPDTEAPVISLVGNAVITLTVGQTYTEQGATVTDNVDTGLVAVISGTVDTSTLGSYTVTYTATDAANNQSSITRSVVVEAVSTPSSNAYIFHSENDDSFFMEFWGDNWSTGTQYTDQPSDTTYAKALEITKSTGWGTVIAWGNQPENAIDISTYTNARFKVKTDTFTGIDVVVQSATEQQSQVVYNFSSGTDLGNGWIEMEVTLPGFSDMTWFSLNFLGDAGTTVLLADIYFTTLEQAPVTGPPQGAPTPPDFADSEVVVLYSDSLTQDSFVGVWNANYFNAPVYSTGAVNGNNFAKYTITAGGTNGGVTGLEFGFENGELDASAHTTWNMDLYIEPGITQVEVQLVSRDGGAKRTFVNPTTGTWLNLEMPYNELVDNDGAGFDTLNSSILQLIVIQLWGPEGTSVYVDNIYFSGVSTAYDMTVNVVDDNNAPLENAAVKIGNETANTNASGDAVLTLPEAQYKVLVEANNFGAAQNNQVIAGGDATLSMSLVPLNEGPSEAAPVPTVANDDAFVLYSDTLNVDKPISFWSDNFFRAPTFSQISIAGDNIAKFQIIPGGETGGITGIQYGIQGGPVDVSGFTGLRFDLYVTSGITQTQFQVIPSYGNAGVSQNFTWPTEQWVTVELPFSSLNTTIDASSLIMFSVQLWGSTSDSVYLDNIYFY
ncbi:immunoglobulin-like domain-containing protein [Glaciecola sp. SC05]|uniref:immunoglobulin-like domain-containing protein n=1 Tax=Glaciecola sp. SC05 TaxID=1987355 RepID=UPI003527E134